MSSAAEAVPMVRGPQRRSMQMWDGDVSYLAWEEASAKAPVLHFAHANGFNAEFQPLRDSNDCAFN